MVIPKDYLRVYDATNDLKQLIPVGTILFIDLPEGFDYNGLPVEHDDKELEWRWLDVNMLPDRYYNDENDALRDTCFLIRYKYFMGTFKLITFGRERCCKIRLYAVPGDRPFSRLIERWRSSLRGSSTLKKKSVRSWSRLMNVVDFTSGQWQGDAINSPCVLIPASSPVNLPSTMNDHHIKRWYNRLPFVFPIEPSTVISLQSQLVELYNSVASPDLSKYKYASFTSSSQPPSSSEVIARLVRAAEDGNVSLPGVESTLYSFQVRSACKMYEKESEPVVDCLPSFIKVRCPDPSDKVYYFDTLGNNFFLDPEVFTLPRGGILAENMGFGKTLICLSLISLTKYEVSKVPADIMIYDEDMASDGPVPYSEKRQSGVPSLVELCRKSINRASLPWKYYMKELPSSVINVLSSVPGSFRISLYEASATLNSRITRNETFKRETFDSKTLGEGVIYKTLYKSSTTLVVVPDNLFHQWNDEMKRHLTPSYLKVLFIFGQFQKQQITCLATFQSFIPTDPKMLVEFDMILISSSILSRLLDLNGMSSSPLFKVYWKRLIVDEGHSMNSKNSRVSQLCKEIYAERRWSVTGTPTSGMTRLQMNEEQIENDISLSPSKKSRYTVKNKFNAKDDLNKLGITVGSFLKVEPFHSQPKFWTSSIIKPMIANDLHAYYSLRHILDALVVRHDLKEVESELELPPLRHVPVFLEPSYHNTLSINLFTAVLAVNAVTSERTDTDYMFHPSNRHQLRRLVTNMQRATFHWTGFKTEDIKTLIDICESAIEKTDDSGRNIYSDDDIKLLMRSLEISSKALHNDRWKTLAMLHEMCYFVEGLPDIFAKHFGVGVIERTDRSGVKEHLTVFGAPHLHSVQEFFYKNRFMNFAEQRMIDEKLALVADPFWKNYWIDISKRNSERFNRLDTNQHFHALNYSKNPFADSNEGKFSKSIPTSLNRKSKPQIETSTEILPDDDLLKEENFRSTIPSVLTDLSFERIKQAQILGTASAKLSYLAARLLENRRNGIKTLVFFEFEDSAYYLSELLDVLGIEYILYATFINPAERATNITKFSTFPSGPNNGVALIIDLKLAAHGLNITAATQVYFINPVWLRSVEAQAIKRAHRIGQTNPVRVETLILKNTLEEEIYRRRSDDAEGKETEQKYVIDDIGMQEYILKHEFLDQSNTDIEYAPFMAPMRRIEMNQEDMNPTDSLLNHFGYVQDLFQKWVVYVFTESNLSKMNAVTNAKLSKTFVRDQFIKRFVEDNDQSKEPAKHKRATAENGQRRKKVRF